jgi:N-acyl-D-amino-acid deacylase
MLSVAMFQTYDLIIRGGTVYDGTGVPGVRADVAVRRDRIAAIGEFEGDAGRLIDAAGMAVSPGFIDVHAHDDAAVLSTPMDFKLMQGVTTDIVGNCGAGVAPALGSGSRGLPGVEVVLGPMPDADWTTFGEYMDAVERAKPAINVGAFVPHGIVRAKHLGMDRRAPEPAELEAMRADVDEGMAAGALGMSTGLIYAPGLFAATDEIVALSEIVAKHGGIYMSHIRNEADGLLDAIDEAITIGREAGLPVEVSHHKASAPTAWGKTADSIKMIEDARAAGQDVTWDAYPYTAGSTILAAARAIREEIDADGVMVSSVRERREYEGKTLREIGEIIGIDDPHEIIARVLSEEPAAVAVFFSMHEDDVRRVLAHPLCMIGSDGIPSPTGKPHPRLYGTFARVLGTYCREVGLFPLEEALRKMTSLPARRMNLAERGELREGWFADVVVFDPEKIDDIATYQAPRQYPTGIEYVIVNGKVAAEGGKQVESHAGRLLRRGQA